MKNPYKEKYKKEDFTSGLIIPDNAGCQEAAIRVEFNAIENTIKIDGWYGHNLYMGSKEMSLGEFFYGLGITKEHLNKAIASIEE